MAKYFLQDMQALLRGMKKVAEVGFKYQTAELNYRFCQSSFRPTALRNSFSESSQKFSQPFDAKEMASRAGAVFRGLQEQAKIVTGMSQPHNFAFDTGILYSNRVGASGVKKYHPTVAETLDNEGHVRPDGEAGEAAKRAEKFMNPPVAPLDTSEKGDGAQNMSEMLEGTESPDKNFMKHETDSLKKDTTFRKDSSKTFIDAGGDSSIRMEDIKKASKIPPGVPIKADSIF